jgi:tRNA (guanine-N7-)-methyltransferase
MRANSSPISSSQVRVHDRLTTIVAKHAANEFKKPYTDYNRAAFDASIAAWQAHGGHPLILDAGCGVGLSTLHLAQQFPDHYVIGVDQSADRIGRNTQWPGTAPTNCGWVRADLIDYWRLLHLHAIRPARQYVLYPNPWPKIGQLQRRWHGHPVFPTIVALGGYFECRSNWQIYIEECSAALTQLTTKTVAAQAYVPQCSITPFESKYLASGHALWRCAVDL